MNTIGKILVILNFLFAVIVGLLLVVDVALRNQWKEAYTNLQRDAKVMEDGRKQSLKVMEKILNDYKRSQQELDDLKQKLKDTEVTAKIVEDGYVAKLEQAKDKLIDSDLSLQQSLKAQKRLADEIAVLNATITDREKAIVKIEADVKKFRNDAVQYQAAANAKQIQNENLLEQNQRLNKEIAKLQSGVNPDVMVVRNPNDPNPPAVTVNGRLEKVEGDLVQISLGTDHGVNKNNTLDVYRTSPEPKYLGMVRIVDANHHKSVARLIPSGNPAFRVPLKEGDLVTSKLTR